MVEENLHPLLRSTDRSGAAELSERVWQEIEPLLDLTDAEREYVSAVQHGDLRPELLFPDDSELVERLRHHPALCWKVDNARRWRERS